MTRSVRSKRSTWVGEGGLQAPLLSGWHTHSPSSLPSSHTLSPLPFCEQPHHATKHFKWSSDLEHADPKYFSYTTTAPPPAPAPPPPPPPPVPYSAPHLESCDECEAHLRGLREPLAAVVGVAVLVIPRLVGRAKEARVLERPLPHMPTAPRLTGSSVRARRMAHQSDIQRSTQCCRVGGRGQHAYDDYMRTCSSVTLAASRVMHV